MIATFLVSGVIHDAAIHAVTRSSTFLFMPWFGILGVMVVITTRIGLRYGFDKWTARAVINVGMVVAGFVLADAGTQLLGIG